MISLDPNATDPFEIIVGTYEQYLLGYKVKNVVNEYAIEKSFATHSHLASMRCVASNKHYLASGGADDSIYLYDMRYRIESGRLMHHNDTVNCIAFSPEASHIFTCSNDGSIAAIRCGNWQIEKHWLKAHKGLPVNTLAIHPTGKIALSTGADGVLRTWNLIKGRQAYAINLVPRLKLDAKNVTVVKWSPNGEKYLLAVNQRVDIYSVELAGVNDEIQFDSKIVCVEFLKDDLIAVGLENGQIKFYDLEKSIQTVDAIAHDIRVKCMALKDNLLVTASSSGEIKLWRYSKHSLDMLQSVNCGARITCLSLAMPCKSLLRDKIKVEEKEEEEEKKERTKFRLRQEVIIEDDDGWDVTPIETINESSVTKKSKSKRSVEETEIVGAQKSKKNKPVSKKKKRETVATEGDVVDDSPKKKKKLAVFDENDNLPAKKRKGSSLLSEENRNIQVKKVKKFTVTPSESGVVRFKKMKKKKSIEENSIILPKKKKRAAIEESSTSLKKKKRKQ